MFSNYEKLIFSEVQSQYSYFKGRHFNDKKLQEDFEVLRNTVLKPIIVTTIIAYHLYTLGITIYLMFAIDQENYKIKPTIVVIVISSLYGCLAISTIICIILRKEKSRRKRLFISLHFYIFTIISMVIKTLRAYIFSTKSDITTSLIRGFYLEIILDIVTYFSLINPAVFLTVVNVLVRVGAFLLAISLTTKPDYTAFVAEIAACVLILPSFAFLRYLFDGFIISIYGEKRKNQFQFEYFKQIIEDSNYIFFAVVGEKIIYFNQSFHQLFNNQFNRIKTESSADFLKDDRIDISSLKILNKSTGQPLHTILREYNSGLNTFNCLGKFIMDIKDDNQIEEEFYFDLYIRKSVSIVNGVTIFDVIAYDITKILRAEKINLEEKFKQELFCKVAHEFKTPLICNGLIIDNMLAQIKEGNMRKAVDYAEETKRLSQYIFLLIDDIMHLTSSKFEICLTPVIKIPTEDIEFSFEILSILIKMKSSRVMSQLIISETARNAFVEVDSLRFRQILVNLISNATKFTNTGQILIKVDSIDNTYKIEVSDSGIGMNEEIARKIFKGERIIDMEINKQHNASGTGTGLNVVKNLCDLMNISINFKTKEHQGTTFTLTLNSKAVKLPEDNKQNSLNDSEATVKYQSTNIKGLFGNSFSKSRDASVLGYDYDSSKKGKIIVCDDYSIVRDSVKKLILGITSSYDVELCFDGIDVLSKMIEDNRNIRLIMIDEHMEFMSGLQTVSIIRNLQSEGKFAKCKIVSISAIDSNNGSSAYDMILQKPVTKLSIISLIEELSNN